MGSVFFRLLLMYLFYMFMLFGSLCLMCLFHVFFAEVGYIVFFPSLFFIKLLKMLAALQFSWTQHIHSPANTSWQPPVPPVPSHRSFSNCRTAAPPHSLFQLEAIASSRLEARASRLEAIASRLEAIASRLEAIASSLGWGPVLLGWRPLLLGWGPLLLAWRPLLLAWRPVLLV